MLSARPLLLSLLVLGALRGCGQFTYIGAELGYMNLGLLKVNGERSNVNRMEFCPSAVHRFGKHFGAGAAIMLPAISRVKVSLDGSPTTDGYNYTDYSTYSVEDDLRFHTFDYTADDHLGGTLFARLFLEDNANLFFDLRLTYARFTERFVLGRSARAGYYDVDQQAWHPALEEVDIDDRITHSMLVPGITFGLSPHIGEHMFLSCYIGLDHYRFPADAFSRTVPYDENYYGELESVTFASRLSGPRIAFRTGLGLGAFF